MFELKKAALATLALSCQIAFAGTMGNLCNPIVSTVPCETRGWDFGITALYLDTRFINEFNDVTLTPGNIRYGEHDNWDWGYKIQGSYHFGTGNDININWYHFKNNSNYLGTYLNLIDDPALFNVNYKPVWNAVNVEFGQLVNFSQLKKIRFHGGMQFARFTHEILLATNADITASAISRFTGIGPRFGADMAYALGYGVSIYANGATSLLVGRSGFNTVQPNNTPFGLHSNGAKTTLTPELETKLGAVYNYMIDQGVLGLDVGYMWVNYFNPHQVLTTETSDFALHGAYFGLTFTGIV